ncbi:MAG: D-alanyl-D-alanine carboxypeptidase, partial [Pseudomonadota bacterium]
REGRVSAAGMAALLRHAWRDSLMPEFVASMSLNGIDGTLRRRHKRGTLTASSHLKTGRLEDVTALAGYVQAQDGARYALVVLHNAPSVHRGTGEVVQDAILSWLHQRKQDVPVNVADEQGNSTMNMENQT